MLTAHRGHCRRRLPVQFSAVIIVVIVVVIIIVIFSSSSNSIVLAAPADIVFCLYVHLLTQRSLNCVGRRVTSNHLQDLLSGLFLKQSI